MSLGGYSDSLLGLLQLKQRNQIIGHELGSDGSADQSGELDGTHCQVLLDLHNAEPFCAPLA